MTGSDPTKADLKAWLAAQGQSLQPDSTMQFFPKPTSKADVVIVDRVRAGWTPPYCLHGYATCVSCDAMCYLGSETQKLLCSSGKAYPLCETCAKRLDADGFDWAGHRIGNTNDHLRVDGPH